MKSTVENLDPTRIKLTVEVPYEELKPSLDAAYKEIGSQIQVPGFRRGHVPNRVIDQRVGRGAARGHKRQQGDTRGRHACGASERAQATGTLRPATTLARRVRGASAMARTASTTRS